MFRGTLNLMIDPNQLNCMDPRINKTIILSDSNVSGNLNYCIRGSILLPPYEASMYMCDNNHEAFYKCYLDHIYTKEALGFLAAIFKAMREGINIFLYVKIDELETFFNCFASIIANEFGIIIGDMNRPFAFSNQYTPKLLSILYDFNFISFEEIVREYPQGLPFPDSNIYKMMDDTKNYGNFKIMSQYFFDLKESLKPNNRLISPFRKGK